MVVYQQAAKEQRHVFQTHKPSRVFTRADRLLHGRSVFPAVYAAGRLAGRNRLYTYCPDHEGRSAILLDNKEIISGGYYNQGVKAHLLPQDETLERRLHEEMPFMDDTALKLGMFDQRCFYEAFDIFDNQSIEKSLASENLLVRIFAVLDRRVGKRTLKKIGEKIESEPKTFRVFYEIRMNAENEKQAVCGSE